MSITAQQPHLVLVHVMCQCSKPRWRCCCLKRILIELEDFSLQSDKNAILRFHTLHGQVLEKECLHKTQ